MGVIINPYSFPNSLMTGLTAYYKCNEASGTIYDSSPNAYNSTASTVTYGQAGKIVPHTSIIASDYTKYVTLPQGNAFQSSHAGNYSIFCWIYLISSNTRLSNMFGHADGPEFYLSTVVGAGSTGVAAVKWYVGGTQSESSSYTFNYSQWYHVGMVKTGDSVQFYINGATQGSAATEANYSISNTCYITSNPYGEWLNGRICHLGIWAGTALVTNQINWLYNSGLGRDYPFRN
jgi:hypothetical protein